MAHSFGKINKAQLMLGAKIEAGEHRWASMRIAERIARDHIRESPGAYLRRVKKR